MGCDRARTINYNGVEMKYRLTEYKRVGVVAESEDREGLKKRAKQLRGKNKESVYVMNEVAWGREDV